MVPLGRSRYEMRGPRLRSEPRRPSAPWKESEPFIERVPNRWSEPTNQ